MVEGQLNVTYVSCKKCCKVWESVSVPGINCWSRGGGIMTAHLVTLLEFFVAYALCSDKSSNFSLPSEFGGKPSLHPLPFQLARIKSFGGSAYSVKLPAAVFVQLHRRHSKLHLLRLFRSPKNRTPPRKIQWILNASANMHLTPEIKIKPAIKPTIPTLYRYPATLNFYTNNKIYLLFTRNYTGYQEQLSTKLSTTRNIRSFAFLFQA